MPEKLDRCVSDVKNEGKSEDSAYAICNDSINEAIDSEEQESVFVGKDQMQETIMRDILNAKVSKPCNCKKNK